MRAGAAGAKLVFTLPRLRQSGEPRPRIVPGREETRVTVENDIVDWAHFERSRTELGPGFIKILGYFREDGVKSIAQIESAMREKNTGALVMPAHTLKGEARQLGAEPLAKIAELIESTARFCVEVRSFPDELVKEVVELRQLFERTVEMFDKATNP